MMNFKERENFTTDDFTKDVILNIMLKLNKQYYKEFWESFTELRNFIRAVRDDSPDIPMLSGYAFNMDDAKDVCASIENNVKDYCSNAYIWCWEAELWYAMTEILKELKVEPQAGLTGFINLFLCMEIKFDEKEDGDETEADLFVRKLKLISSLGQPQQISDKPVIESKDWFNEIFS